jgi:hypothetical protein
MSALDSTRQEGAMKRQRVWAVQVHVHALRGSDVSLAAYCRYAGWSYATAQAWRVRWVRDLFGPRPRFGAAA